MGIVQSEILLKSAIENGFTYLRENVTLFNDMFRELLDDPLVSPDDDTTFTESLVDRAKAWFLGTKIRTKLGLQVNPGDIPVVAIGIGSSIESQSTLGDVGWEDEAYSYGSTGFGVNATETYTLSLYEHDIEQLLWLHTIVLYMLLFLKSQNLETRGVMISRINSSPLAAMDTEVQGSAPEHIYTREITITSTVRHTWGPVNPSEIGTVESNIMPELVQEYGTQLTEITSEDDLDQLDEQDMILGYEITES